VKQKLLRWAGLSAFLGAILQFLVSLPGTAAEYREAPWGIADLWVSMIEPWLAPILTFDSAYTVYHMYDGLWMIPVPLLIAGLVALYHAYPVGPWGRLAQAGFRVSALGLTLLLIGNGSEAWFAYVDWFGVHSLAFFAATFPGLILTLVGATLLGLALLRGRAIHPLVAWLLILGGFPGGAIFGVFVGGHFFGFLWLIDLAWMVIGYRLWRELPLPAAPRATRAEALANA